MKPKLRPVSSVDKDPSTTDIDSRPMTTAEAAEYLRYRSRAGVLMAVRRGQLEPMGRRGRILLFRKSDLDAMVERGREAPKAETAVVESGVSRQAAVAMKVRPADHSPGQTREFRKLLVDE